MRKSIIKFIYIVAVFIVSLIVISNMSNQESVDMTADMQIATFPIVSLKNGTNQVNSMHGYASEMDCNYMRGAILPTSDDRKLNFVIDTYNNSIDKITFEVRQIDGSSLVESTEITDYSEKNGTISGKFQLKELIDQNKEYILVMLLETNGNTIRYYSRVVWTGEDDERYYVDEHIDFVKNFSETTFDKDASDELTKYLESNSEGDNTSFAKVNIHSSLSQVTWGDLTIKSHTEPEITVTDIHSQTAIIELDYRVTILNDSDEEEYFVKEVYRTRYTSDRIYLLNYERTMEYIFDAESKDITSTLINLHISDTEMDIVENDSGTAFAFVSSDRLFVYNGTEDKMALLFGFYDDDNYDERTLWRKNKTRILSVDEGGNVSFVVSGYMNRGIYEGRVGTAVYSYNSTINTIEEMAFIPSTRSPEVQMAYIEDLAYVNGSDTFFMSYEGDVYSISLVDQTYNRIIENMVAGSYRISESNSVIAWQDSDMTSLKVMNLTTQTVSEIQSDEGDYIKILGFMGEDIVYGLVHQQDIHEDQMGNPVYAMYSLIIRDTDGNILEEYSPNGIYILSVTISDNQIKMSRVTWDEESSTYVATYDDQIMSTLEAESGKNTVTVVTLDIYESIVEIVAKNDISNKKLIVQTPDFTMYEGSKEADIEADISQENKNIYYYVYGLGKMEGYFIDEAEAVQVAYDSPGVVVDNSNKYIYYKGNLLTSNQNMTITKLAQSMDNMTEENSIAVCLDLMLQYEGLNRDTQALLDEGNSIIEILESSFQNAQILDLDGCPLEAMLYYVNQDIPVLARLNNGKTVLIVGFNSLNTVLIDPEQGTIYKYGMKDSKALFEENGNHFITYIMED
ncbi:MAG: hypothetical protein K6A23_09525 [Butyrivibrio sp.]|nr:hypothetical protein [Butyrivibrio sp.]